MYRQHTPAVHFQATNGSDSSRSRTVDRNHNPRSTRYTWSWPPYPWQPFIAMPPPVHNPLHDRYVKALLRLNATYYSWPRSYAIQWPSQLGPYPNSPIAMGWPASHTQPSLCLFDFWLTVFRGNSKSLLCIKRYWDDERLLMGLSEKYNHLRGWRRFLSLIEQDLHARRSEHHTGWATAMLDTFPAICSRDVAQFISLLFAS